MHQPEPHPDTLNDLRALKAITRGGMEAIEDKAIAGYMRTFEAGREKAEEIFFSFFNNKPCTV